MAKARETGPQVIEPVAVDVPGAARFIGTSDKFVRRLLRRQEIVPIRLPHCRKLLIAVDDLRAYIAKQRAAA